MHGTISHAARAWIVVALTAPLAVTAAPASERAPVADLLACGVQTDDEARLACYDGLRDSYLETQALEPVEIPAETPVVVAPAAVATVEAREEAEFGVEHYQSNKSTNEITSEVVSIERNAVGGLVLTLGNDQIWQQSDRSRLQVNPGDRVTISRGSFSAFYLRVGDGKKRARFSRVL